MCLVGLVEVTLKYSSCTKTYVVSVVVGALGMIPKNLKQHLKTISATVKVELLQKAALLGTGRLVRKVFEA